MKKTLLLIAIALTLTGCNPQQEQTTQSESEASQEFSELAAAMESGAAMRCIMSNTAENIEATYLVRGDQIKISGMIPNDEMGDANMLMTNNTIYTWSSKQETGLIIKVPEEQADQVRQEQDIPDLSNPQEREAYQNQGFTIDCEPADLTDADFTPPSDVNFMDMSSFIQQSMEAN